MTLKKSLLHFTKRTTYISSAKFLGDQRSSYNQDLKFKLRIDQVGPRPAAEDIIILGGGAKTTKIALTITEQNNPLPETQVNIYDCSGSRPGYLKNSMGVVSANGGSILSSSQFLILPQQPQKIKLASKVVKVDSKIIIQLP